MPSAPTLYVEGERLTKRREPYVESLGCPFLECGYEAADADEYQAHIGLDHGLEAVSGEVINQEGVGDGDDTSEQ